MKAIQNEEKEVVREKLMELIKPYLPAGINLSAIDDNSDFIGDLKVNSIRFVDIIMDMEEKFDVRIDDQAADSILTIGDAIAIVLNK